MVAVEQFLEGEAVSRDMRCQQFSIAALSGALPANLRGAHRRTV